MDIYGGMVQWKCTPTELKKFLEHTLDRNEKQLKFMSIAYSILYTPNILFPCVVNI